MMPISDMDRRSGLDRRAVSDYPGTERRIADRRSGTDRRKFARHIPKDIVLVKLRSGAGGTVGQLLDISKRGVSAKFPERIDRKKDCSKLEIFSFFHDFAIQKIPFQTVSNPGLDYESQLPAPSSRRHRFQFESLTFEQEVQLDFLLKNYTLGRG